MSDDGKIVTLDCVTTLDISPDRVLQAPVGTLRMVLVIGVTTEGQEYFAGSTADLAELNYLADRFKHFVQVEADKRNA